jgi:hypothetical protein
VLVMLGDMVSLGAVACYPGTERNRCVRWWKPMRTENLQEAVKAAPFRPFTMRLADGSMVEVKHPEWIAHPSGTRTAVVMGPDGSVKIIDVALILSIEQGPPVPAGTVAPDPNGGG